VHLTGKQAVPVPWWLGALHGLIGLSGLALLALSLRGPVRGLAQGTASFGAIGAGFIGSAALIGGNILLRHRRGKRAGGLIGVHATLAICGFVMLAAYVFA
jgi:hypothetical protein